MKDYPKKHVIVCNKLDLGKIKKILDEQKIEYTVPDVSIFGFIKVCFTNFDVYSKAKKILRLQITIKEYHAKNAAEYRF